MDQARLFLAIGLSFLIFFLWSTFFTEKEDLSKKEKQHTESVEQNETVKEIQKENEEVAQPLEKETDGIETDTANENDYRTIKIDTPLYSAEISEKGAIIKSFKLKKYRESVQKDAPLKEIVSTSNKKGTLFVSFENESIPGIQDAVYKADVDNEEIIVKHDEKEILFSWQTKDGVVIEKRMVFSPETYLIRFDIIVKSRATNIISDKMTISLYKEIPEKTRAYGFEGPSTYIDNSLEQIDFDDIEDKNLYTGKIDWIAAEDRYFIASVIPEKKENGELFLDTKEGKLLQVKYIQPEKSIQPGTQHTYKYQLYFGPKSMKVLSTYDNRLEKAINFGIFDILAKPCLWIMNMLYRVIPNYGIAIIIMTLFIKIILWPLGSKSYKSMNEMKKIQPLMTEIREKYKNDKKKMNQEVMGLYKTYKINPLGGCLPMVVQLPVFFALYRMLYEAIELRHAPFFLWINDLSAPDRLFNFAFSIPFMEPPYGIPVLTVIMGASMLLQQKMSPPMGDPMQAKMMMLMPVVFTVIFINFSSGLVLYWLVNNVLSIGQQYYIQKKAA